MTTTEIDKLTNQITQEIGLNDVEEGDLRCKQVRLAAAKKLAQTIADHVIMRDPIAYPSKSASPLFDFVIKVAERGDIGMGELNQTRAAIALVIKKMIQTYQLPDDERKKIYAETLTILVATHPLLDA